jgi:mannose-6-phosphate isomerase
LTENDDSIRPWGHYEVLYDGEDCKVKRIIVKSGGKLSYQYHNHREEYWQVISGNGVVTIQDTDLDIGPGAQVRIPKGVRHRVRNNWKKDLVFIEIQTGDYFGEDDIVRLEDDYGRLTKTEESQRSIPGNPTPWYSMDDPS